MKVGRLAGSAGRPLDQAIGCVECVVILMATSVPSSYGFRCKLNDPLRSVNKAKSFVTGAMIHAPRLPAYMMAKTVTVSIDQYSFIET